MRKALCIGMLGAALLCAESLAPGHFSETKEKITTNSFDLRKYPFGNGLNCGFVVYLSTERAEIEVYQVTIRYQVGLFNTKEQTKLVARNWPWAVTPVFFAVEDPDYTLQSITVRPLVVGEGVTFRP